MSVKVTAPLVVATTENGRVMHLYRGDIVPSDVTKESLDNLKSLGFVADAKAADKADVEKPVK